MNKPWQPYALHILDAIARIRRIVARGNIIDDDVLYDTALRNLQTLSEAKAILSGKPKSNISFQVSYLTSMYSDKAWRTRQRIFETGLLQLLYIQHTLHWH